MSEQDYDGYMEGEEEWDREGLLDPAWEKQQKKVGFISFTCLMYILYGLHERSVANFA